MPPPDAFGHEFVTDLVERSLAAASWREETGDAGGPRMRFSSAEDPAREAGTLRLWHAAPESRLDRMVHARLLGSPVDTNLFFIFGRSDTVMPHFHGQVVQFGPDACVYNADLLPRLDPVDHPAYFEAVFGPITQAYWKATQKPENACASAPGNPAIAAYLSPWSIGAGRPTQRAELARVGAQIHAYLEHYLGLDKGLHYPEPDAELMRSRDRRHLDCFFSEDLDPRAWKGVYRLVGAEPGRQMRRIIMNK